MPFLKSQPATIPCKRDSQQDEFLKVSQKGDIAGTFIQFGHVIVCHYGDFSITDKPQLTGSSWSLDVLRILNSLVG